MYSTAERMGVICNIFQIIEVECIFQLLTDTSKQSLRILGFWFLIFCCCHYIIHLTIDCWLQKIGTINIYFWLLSHYSSLLIVACKKKLRTIKTTKYWCTVQQRWWVQYVVAFANHWVVKNSTVDWAQLIVQHFLPLWSVLTPPKKECRCLCWLKRQDLWNINYFTPQNNNMFMAWNGV